MIPSAEPRQVRSPRVLVTAGPTRERIDAVRYISNRSSGRMGAALARSALRRGSQVTLLLGPVQESLVPEVERAVEREVERAVEREAERAAGEAIAEGKGAPLRLLRFECTEDLAQLLDAEWPRHDLLIMAAAVSDHRPVIDERLLGHHGGKLPRKGGPMTLQLEPTPDLLAGLAATTRADQMAIGFALEPAARLEESALDKLHRKGLHGIVANPLETMDAETIDGTLLLADGRRLAPLERPCTKEQFAEWLVDRLMDLWVRLGTP